MWLKVPKSEMGGEPLKKIPYRGLHPILWVATKVTQVAELNEGVRSVGAQDCHTKKVAKREGQGLSLLGKQPQEPIGGSRIRRADTELLLSVIE